MRRNRQFCVYAHSRSVDILLFVSSLVREGPTPVTLGLDRYLGRTQGRTPIPAKVTGTVVMEGLHGSLVFIERTQRMWRSVACACLVVGCSAAEAPTQELTVLAQDSAGVRIMQLSRSIREVARGMLSTTELEADLVIGGVEEGFGHLADVTTVADGRIAILDRMEKTIWLYDHQGKRLGSIGREGKGPGEFTNPVALAWTGARFVVMQPDPTRALTVLDSAGRQVSTSYPNEPAGDWAMHARRGTLQMLDWPYQSSSEDWTRRLGPFGPDGFAYQIQPDERLAVRFGEEFPFEAPPVFLISFDIEGRIVDTIEVWEGPPVRNYSTPAGSEPQFDQPIFARRPVWAAGHDWYAVGHGRQSEIAIRSFDGTLVGVVRWASQEEPITDEDKTAAALWLKETGFRDRSDGETLRRNWARTSSREKQRWIDFHKEYWMWPDAAPTVTGLYGAENCLWIGGFNAADYPDGTALTWVVINVVEGKLRRVVRIPRGGSRIRHADTEAVYVSYRDNNSIHYLERYPVPNLGCRS